MVEWDAQIDQLKYKAENAPQGMKSEYCRKVEALQRKRKEAEAQLQGVSAADDDTWEELASGAEKAWDEIRNSLHDTIVNIR